MILRHTRLFPAILLLTALLCSCSASPAPSLSPEERTQLYRSAIESARDQETNEALPVLSDPEDERADLLLSLLGVTPEDLESFAVAVSPMNIKAYGIALILPADGREDVVRDGLDSFVETQKNNFEFYLADQYAIAEDARVETLADGTCLLVLCEDADGVLDAIRSTLEEGGIPAGLS